MNNGILRASYFTLSKSKKLLSKLSNSQLCVDNIPPYNSSIGSHIRHILDFYKCIFNGIEDGLINLTSRERDLSVEKDCNSAFRYLDSILSKLENSNFENNATIDVIDDLGKGNLKITYTIGAVFAQANSHTIHHYAIINYILDRLGIVMDDDDFGMNPTSPKKELNIN